MRNTYVREHFWSNEFIKGLQNKLHLRKSIGEKSRGGMSRTYEDLQVAHPVNIFEDYQQNLFEDDNNLDQAYLAQTGAINP